VRGTQSVDWLGTLLGGGVGLALGGPLGALVGAALGHGVDRLGLLQRRRRPSPTVAPADRKGSVRGGFLHPTFAVMGHLAKADGRVSEREIALAASVMARLQLSAGQRRAAIASFNQGKSPAFALDQALAALRQDCAGRGVMLRLFLDMQFQMAYVDGTPGTEVMALLLHIARHLDVSDAVFHALDQLAKFRRGAARAGGPRSGWRSDRARTGSGARARPARPSGDGAGLAAAYAALGVPNTATEAEVKRAYRRLLSRNHPDKLVSKGLPPDMLKLADEKTYQIRRAYETITRARDA
jgi:DnaJ like chaperone protein